MELNYDWGNIYAGNIQLNGNISSVTWSGKGIGVKGAYGYSYDKANRLSGADYNENNGSGYVDNALVNFDVVMSDGTTV